jgi:hypothetical protein
MKRKIFIGIGVFLVLIVGAMAYLNNRNRTLSPPGESSITNNDFEISVKYSRPSVKDRIIFGSESAGALQPYGKYWRLGANEATEVTFNKDVNVLDASLAAGSYTLYAIPGEESFEIYFNTDLGKWGAFEPDHSRDVVSVVVPNQQGGHTEQFTINFENQGNETHMNCMFGTTKFAIPFNPQNN